MALTAEQKKALDDLLAAGVISQAEYTAKVNPPETVSGKKFLSGMVSVFDPVKWLKDITSIFNVRKLLIYILAIGLFFGYGYLKGIGNRPVYLDIEGKEARIKLNGETLHIRANGTAEVLDTKTGKKIKDICVKDVPGLQAVLKPIGLQLKPFALVGTGAGFGGDQDTTVALEGGVGVAWFKWYLWNLDSSITNKGFYPLGISKRFEQKALQNTSIGISGGIGYEGDIRGLTSLHWNF